MEYKTPVEMIGKYYLRGPNTIMKIVSDTGRKKEILPSVWHHYFMIELFDLTTAESKTEFWLLGPTDNSMTHEELTTGFIEKKIDIYSKSIAFMDTLRITNDLIIQK